MLLVLALCICAVGGFALYYLQLRRQALSAWPEATARKYLDLFLSDQAELSRSGLFASSRSGRSVGRLTDGVPWCAALARRRIRRRTRPQRLHLPTERRRQVLLAQEIQVGVK